NDGVHRKNRRFDIISHFLVELAVKVFSSYFFWSSKMADAPVRIGVIGVGQIGKMHLERYSKIPNANIVAISDINEAEARRVAALYNIPDVYTDFHDLLKRDDIEAVDVCLHNNMHMPMTVAALQAGKHVYCEKPMAGAYVDAEEMLATARAVDRKLAIQFFSLYSDPTKAAKSL